MRIRDSGMPDETYWESLYDVPLILTKLDVPRFHDAAEMGCGYGTFSIPVARAISGTLYTFDIEPTMVERTSARAAGLKVIAEARDVMERGFGVTVDAVLLFNILHGERPVALLEHARSALRAGGEVLVVHWRSDVATPRGPAADIRPRPEQIAAWGLQANMTAGEIIDLPPWHYGMRLGLARRRR